MISGNIQNLKTEAGLMPAAIVRGLAYLAANDIAGLPVGRIELEGDKLYVLVQDYATVAPSEKRPEAHDKYLDIQYIANGAEEIGWCVRHDGLENAEDLRRDKDVIFFKNIADETKLVLCSGMYAIFFPNDVHRPGCIHGKSQAVRKAVVKISIDLL